MRTNRLVAAATGVTCLFIAQAAAAQPRWGRERVPNQGACFYEDTNFRGRYFCVRPGEQLRSMPNKMGDEISSIRLLGASEITVFRDSDMRGRSARFINDVRDLKREGWNDQISSMDISDARDYSAYGRYDDYGDRAPGRARGRGRNQDRGWRSDRNPVWGRTPIPQEGACFYEDSDFRGQYFCVPRGGTYTSLPRGFNDRISSIRVFGGAVRIFQDRNFRGRSTEITRDVPNLRGNWRDDVSSIRVF